ncbi:hypothetical protein EMMF5_005742 [Cystobasidiomycetes sp. EMM_F5]
MVFACKKCRKTFRKDMSIYEDSDEYCPHCDNHYVRLIVYSMTRIDFFRAQQVIEAKEPQAMLVTESEDARIDNRAIRDPRVEEQRQRDLQESLRELEDLMAEYVKLQAQCCFYISRAVLMSSNTVRAD